MFLSKSVVALTSMFHLRWTPRSAGLVTAESSLAPAYRPGHQLCHRPFFSKAWRRLRRSFRVRVQASEVCAVIAPSLIHLTHEPLRRILRVSAWPECPQVAPIRRSRTPCFAPARCQATLRKFPSRAPSGHLAKPRSLEARTPELHSGVERPRSGPVRLYLD